MSLMHTVHATGPGDLLALVPSLLGFHPDGSVVLLTVGDAPQPFHARVDLPTGAEDAGELASYLTAVAVRSGVRRVAVVVYTDDRGLARCVVDALVDEMVVEGIEPVCVLRADGRRWWALDSGDETRGTRYDVSSHPLMAQAVVDGTVVLGSRQELVDSLVGNDPAEACEISALAEVEAARLAPLATARRVPASGRGLGPTEARRELGVEARWVAHRVRRFLEDGERLGSGELARLVTLMDVSVEIRDVAWAGMARADADQHVDLWRDVVRRVPRDLRAAPAALLGFAAWLAGNGALAWCAVECARRSEPGYRLAELLAQALSGAVPPSAWRPSSQEELTLLEE